MATLGETAKAYEPQDNPCIECGKKLKYKPSLRCRSCWVLFANRGRNIPSTTGENNHKWVGDKVGYRALHAWVNRHKPKGNKCSQCGKEKKLQAANISGEYKRDVSDYEWLCAKCHIYKDGTINNLNATKEVKHGKTIGSC